MTDLGMSVDPEKKQTFSPFQERIMDNKLVLIIIALLLPPLAVFMKSGAGKDLVINILLCFVFWVPAIVHSLWVVSQ